MTDQQPQLPGRKIKLSPYFCPYAYTEGGLPKCDHDYPPEPSSESSYGATWTCTRCGMKTTFDLWD